MFRHPLLTSVFVCFFNFGFIGVGLASSPSLIDLKTPLHFLTPSGDDVTLAAGTYHIQAVESWLKLVPEGGAGTEAILLEGTPGNHEEDLTGPASRLTQDPENSDVYHLAVLLMDGTGVEAIGTASGIYARSTRLSFLQRRTRRSATGGLAGRRLPRGFPGGSTSTVQCHTHTKTASAHDRVAPALVEFKGKLLNFVARNTSQVRSGSKYQYIESIEYRPSRGGPTDWNEYTPVHGLGSDHRIALAIFQDKLHMIFVGRGNKKHQLWHKWTTDLKFWSPAKQIPNQYSKEEPALAVFDGKLHMVHLGKSSNDIWHSMFDGNSWTPNVNTGKKSWKTPSLAVSPPEFGPSRLHMIHNVKNKNPFKPADFLNLELYHSIFEGTFWSKRQRIKGSFSKDATTLVTHGPRFILVHRGKTSDKLWRIVYGKNSRTGKIEWFGNKRLHNWTAKSPVALARHKGCWHLLSKEGNNYSHHIFSIF